MMMKRPVHPLLSILFLFATTAAFWFCANYVSGVGVYTFFTSEVGETQPLSPVTNVSLLMFSAVDLADDVLRQNVQQLKEVQRSFLSYVGARSALGGPMKLMSPEFFKIWLDFQRNLQDWWSHRRFEPGVMSNLVNITSKISGSSKSFKYKTCAVVGNSGILLNSNQGVKIDSHEFVIRLNNARTNSYEQFVGSKTSLSFMNSNILHFCSRRESCYCHPYGRKVPIMAYISQPVHFLDYVVCNSSHKAPLTITDPQLDVLCARIVKYYSVKRFLKETGKPLEEWSSSHGGVEFHYSSGMQAVMFALGVCDKVSLFGFGKSDSGKHHYHTNQKSELGLHDYLAEYDLYHDLANSAEVVPFVSDTLKFPPVTIHA